MTTEELEKIIAQGENAKVDFKRQWYKDAGKNELKSEFVKDMLALANGDIHTTDKTAYLIIGITDGTTDAYSFDDSAIPRSLDKLTKQLLEILNNYAQPEFLSLKVEWVDYQQEELLVLSVLPHPRLISLSKDLRLKKGTDNKGTVYYRIGENNRVASADVIRDFDKAFAKGNTQNGVSITVNGDVKGVVNAENGSVINQTIS
jgi:predicted HTH transcriptional regulator